MRVLEGSARVLSGTLNTVFPSDSNEARVVSRGAGYRRRTVGLIVLSTVLFTAATANAQYDAVSPLLHQADTFPPQHPLAVPNALRPHPEAPDVGGWSTILQEAHRLSGYIVYQKPWMAGHEQWSGSGEKRPGGDRFIDPPRLNEVRGPSNPIELHGVGGEILPIVLQLYSFTELRNIRVDFRELRGPGVLAKNECVSIRWLLTSRMIPNRALPCELSDGWLMGPKSIDGMAANTMNECWILLWIPPGTIVGTYEGGLTVSSEGKPPTDIEVTVEILPIEIDESPYIHGLWHGGDSSLGPEGVYADQLRLMRAWGFNGDGIGPACPAPNERLPDFSDLYDYLQRCQEEGIRNPIWGSYSENVALRNIPGPLLRNPKWIAGHLQTIDKYLLERPDLPDVIVCLADRTDDLEILDEVIQTVVEPVSALNLSRVKTAFIVADQEAFELSVGLCDVLFQSSACSDYLSNFARGRDAGTIVYDMDPGFSRAGFGIYLWRLAAEGCPGGFEYVFGLERNRFLATVDAHRNRYITSTAWVGASIGTWDVRYIVTLERLIRENPSHPTAIEAAEFLRQIYNMIAVESGDRGRFRQMWPPSMYDGLRKRVTAYILELTAG